jgi:hypothetical protein
MAGSPPVALFRNRVYLALRSGRTMGGSDRTLYCFASDSLAAEPRSDVRDTAGDVWVAPSGGFLSHEDIGSSDGSQSLVVYRDRLYCFHKGTGGPFDTSQIREIAGMTAEIAGELLDEPRALAGALGLGALAVAGAAIGQAIKLNNSRPGDWTWMRAFDGHGWGPPSVLVPTAEDAYGVNSESVAVATYLNKLVCIRQGRDDSALWCGEFDGTHWLKDQPMQRHGRVFCTTGAPALVVYRGTLYCFHDDHLFRGAAGIQGRRHLHRAGRRLLPRARPGYL